MPSQNPHILQKQTGFSLVEILVGLVIGLLATLVIMQVFSVFEGQKRSTTGASDAQTSGGIALYSLVRDLQMAGYGLAPIGDPAVSDSGIECTSLTIDTATGYDVGAGPAVLSPVIIGDGLNGTSDTITLHYGNSDTAGLPSQLTVDLSAGASAVATVSNNLSCLGSHTLLTIMGGGNCALTTATAVATASNVTQTITLHEAVNAPSDTYLSCMGQWREVNYTVNAGNMERDGVPVVADIVNIQAQYGLSNSVDTNEVTSWEEPTGTFAAGAITVADRNRIKALRVAVIARNGQLEKDVVSSTCSHYSSAAPTGVCAWEGDAANAAPAVNLNTADNPNWDHYRYRVFETIIPLRNVIWSKGTL